MPLGDINSTIHTLITLNPTVDFIYYYEFDHRSFQLDTREFEIFLETSLSILTEVSTYIKEYLKENQREVDDGIQV